MSKKISRRDFVSRMATGVGALTVAPMIARSALAQAEEKRTRRKYGVALVGLGYYSTDLLAPALQETHNTRLAGIVTGTPAKEKTWAEKYGIPAKNIYNYETFDKITDNPDIDIIYVVLPNSMHKEYTIRAANTGKQVICEKPMALTAADCREMIDACKKNNVSLSIGYRMQFEPSTQEIMRYGKEQVFGKVEYVSAQAGFKNRSPKTHWKLQKAYGGGVLMDMGVYSIQGARYVIGEEPTTVTARQFKTDLQRFDEVDEIVTMQLEFPGGAMANLMTSFFTSTNMLYAAAEKGWFELNPFSSYRGIKGNSSKGPIDFPVINQQAAQMDEVAWCIENKQPMWVPGEEGLKDMIVVEGVRKALATGNKIKLV
jgi:glucose-fructose oxidoreductase